MGRLARHGWTLVPGGLAGLLLLALAGALFAALLFSPHTGEATRQVFTAPVLRVLRITLLQAGLSTGLALAMAGLLAWCLHHRSHFPGRALLITLMSAAMVLPTLVVMLGLVSVFGRKGWLALASERLLDISFENGIYGLSGILLAHAYLNAPFLARGLLLRLDAIPLEQRKLAAALNLAPWSRFRVLEWPAMASAVPGLAAIVFLLCFTSFAIVLTLGGSPKWNSLEVAIWEAVRLDFDLPHAARLALLQLVVCAGLVMLASGARVAPFAILAGSRPLWHDGSRLGSLQYAVIAVFAVFFLLPLAAVLRDGLAAELVALAGQTEFQQALITSLLLALASAALAIAIALSIAVARASLTTPGRLAASRCWPLLDRLLALSAAVYLAVPALVLGFGFFLGARALFGDVMAVGPAAVLTANVLLALPFALAVFQPTLRHSYERHDRLAASLGLKGLARWRYIELAALRSDLAFVFALAFCFSLGDLGVIALFGSTDFVTLPWLLYQKLGSYRTSEAAGIAFILLLLVIFVFALSARLFRSPGHAAT